MLPVMPTQNSREPSDFLPAPEGAGLPDSSNTFGFIHRLEFDTVRAYCVVA